MASNSNSIQDPQGQYEDWIEIHNFGSSPINVGGMFLTDDLSFPTKWQIPNNNPSATVITQGSYLLTWADNDTGDAGGYIGEVADTKFSHNRGFYDEPFYMTIATETEGAMIYYTLDGSEPYSTSGRAQGGMVYAAPIVINRTTCLRAVAIKPGWMPT